MYHAVSVRGRGHERNEDFHVACDDLVIVADGMGGERDGNVAARMAVDHIACRLSELDFSALDLDGARSHALSAINEADRAIEAYMDSHPMSMGMGTTILLLMFCGDEACIAWCGDSRCYLYDSRGALRSLTKDHSYVQELIDDGELTLEDSFSHPDSNIITRYVGGGEQMCVPEFTSCRLSESDILLLCSDGISGYCRDEDIRDCVAAVEDLSRLPRELTELALRHGSEDDITIVVCGGATGHPKRGWLSRMLHRD